jgi:tetratricopeptide (TPR) repeat protein
MGIIVNTGYAQSAKKCYKNAKKLNESQEYQEALEQLNQAILKDKDLTDAYILRAQISEKLNDLNGAAVDYEKASVLSTKITDYYYQAGRLNYIAGNFSKALDDLELAIALDDGNFQAYIFKALSQIKLIDYHEALLSIDQAMELDQTEMCFYIRGVANDSLQNYPKAIINYNKAIAMNPYLKEAYLAVSETFIKTQKLDDALFIANKAVQNFPETPEFYEIRSTIFYQRGEILNAINDLSKWETIANGNSSIIFRRGIYYFEFEQFQNAKSDFTQVMANDPSNYMATYWRGRSNEELMEENLAIVDYKLFLNQANYYRINSDEVGIAKQRLFELNRENDAPAIVIDSPLVMNNNRIAVNTKGENTVISGRIVDTSSISFFTINDKNVKLSSDKEFSLKVNTTDLENISFKASDIYGNTAKVDYNLVLFEKDLPTIQITSPKITNSGELLVQPNDTVLLMEGIIEDASLIKEIVINEEPIQFDIEKYNPIFKVAVSVLNIQSITIKVIDEFYNIQEKSFNLSR